jgi:hypothetical protein
LEISLKPATFADIEELAENLRDEDLEEARAYGLPPIVGLTMSFRTSYEVWTGRVDGELVTVFGIAKKTALSDEGVPWLMGTPLVEKYGFAFARRNKAMVKSWRERHPVMRNFIDTRNKTSIRWLKWLGFELLDPVPFGPKQIPFHPFEMRR